MRFNPKANIGGGRISGGGGGLGGRAGGNLGGALGGGRLPIPGGLGIKGTILVIVLYFVLTQCFNVNLGGVLGGGDSTGSNTGGLGSAQVSSAEGDDTYANCKTGEDANNDVDCARMAVAFSLEQFWETQIKGFKAAPMVTFAGQTSTGCGAANSGMGPFYCPADQTIYEDPSFYKEILEGQLGGQGGDFVEPYVLGHEYGHHIQNITGQMSNVRTQRGPDSDAVKLELQADCYAGVWTKAATGTTDDSGVPIFESIDEGDITEAINAANAVGDDHIQKVTQGRVEDSQWTHGSSEQRIQWFKTGLESGDPNSCDIWG